MEAKVIFSVLTENHEGPTGDYWKYWIEAKVFNQGLQGQDTIEVAKHTLPDGVTKVPPGHWARRSLETVQSSYVLPLFADADTVEAVSGNRGDYKAFVRFGENEAAGYANGGTGHNINGKVIVGLYPAPGYIGRAQVSRDSVFQTVSLMNKCGALECDRAVA